jgi:uncharacterized membrane protein
MARSTAVAHHEYSSEEPAVRRIGVGDLQQALWRGLDDFQAKPSHLIFLGIIYPIAALILSRLTFGYQVLPLLFPLAAGFALIGPLAAIGLYELSRRREQGQEIRVKHAFGVLKSPSIGAILALGGILALIFLIWLGVATWLYRATMGEFPASLGQFLGELFTTSGGWTLIVVGNAVGFLFALAVLMIGAVSFPMLVDRKTSAFNAAHTSVRAFLANPRTMTLWGLIVAASLVIGSLPFFVGLAIVVPVLGHATWHLYRRVVVSD